MMGNGMTGDGMGIWMLFGIVFWILIIVGIVLLVVWVVQKALGGGAGGTEGSVLEILKKRYARGEISKEEFEEKKRDLL
ncbi:MAG: SHOCT domain-containing protein [Nitrospirae bacterium]|nr:SHOCT domain-containing protein [Nitrospirota bacterium]